MPAGSGVGDVAVVIPARNEADRIAATVTAAGAWCSTAGVPPAIARRRRMARPPGSPDPSAINVLVGNATAGAAYFKGNCAGCHSVDRDLKGIAAKFDDPRDLQNTWVSGGRGGARGRGGDDGRALKTTVTFGDGRKLEGTLVRRDDFIVTMILADGTRQSFTRSDGVPEVVVHDPKEPHKKLALTLDDTQMHDVTAYLATVK